MLIHLISCCLLMASSTLKTLNIITSQPNNVFHTGEPISLNILDAPPNDGPIAFKVTDFEGNSVVSSAFDAKGSATIAPLNAGYYQITAMDSPKNTGITYLTVLPKIVQHHGSPIAVDAADCWLVSPPYFDDVAQLLQEAGFSRVRERLSWGDVEPSRGTFQWGKYDACIQSEHQHGIQVDQIFHSIPAWARADHATDRFPDDLRDVYHFTRTAAIHYHGEISSWEIWNEPDIGFSVDSAADYAAFMKAATLGFKAGDPSVKILQAAMANGASPYEESLYRNDTQAYFDIFNYHIYADPSDYPARAQGHFNLLNRYHVPTKPVWITEAGIHLFAPDNTLSLWQMKTQAEFIPKSYAMSFASGTNKHFYFVFPHYMENMVEFGVLNQNRIPYAGYSALATLNHLVGDMRYEGLGRFQALPTLQAHLFTDGKKDVWLLWATSDSVAFHPGCKEKNVQVYDCVGQSLPDNNNSGDGSLKLVVTSSPIYLVTKHGAIATHMKAKLAGRKYIAPIHGAPSPIVLRLLPPFKYYHRDGEEYLFSAGQWIPVRFEIYNFSAKQVTIRLQCTLPSQWRIKPFPRKVIINAMGEVKQTLLVYPNGKDMTPGQELRFTATPVGVSRKSKSLASISIATLNVSLDPQSVSPSDVTPIHISGADPWKDSTSRNGSMTHSLGAIGQYDFDIHFDKQGDRWAYPQMIFSKPVNWSRYQAISLQYRAISTDSKMLVRVMLQTPSNSLYFTSGGFPPSDTWRTAVIPFNTLQWGTFSPPDPEGKLDLKKLRGLIIGCNTTADHVQLQVRNLKLLRYHK